MTALFVPLQLQQWFALHCQHRVVYKSPWKISGHCLPFGLLWILMSKFDIQIESLKGEFGVAACDCTDWFLGGVLAHNIFTIHAQWACGKVTPMDVAAADVAPARHSNGRHSSGCCASGKTPLIWTMTMTVWLYGLYKWVWKSFLFSAETETES